MMKKLFLIPFLLMTTLAIADVVDLDKKCVGYPSTMFDHGESTPISSKTKLAWNIILKYDEDGDAEGELIGDMLGNEYEIQADQIYDLSFWDMDQKNSDYLSIEAEHSEDITDYSKHKLVIYKKPTQDIYQEVKNLLISYVSIDTSEEGLKKIDKIIQEDKKRFEDINLVPNTFMLGRFGTLFYGACK